MTEFKNKHIAVTGGAGFLGSFVVEKLRERGVKEIFVPHSKDYNLVNPEIARQLYADSSPDILIHMAARVGGIGANQANPGRFFYENMAMGLNIIEEARKHGVEKLVIVGTTCAYPKFTPVPFKEKDIWNGYPEETNASYGIAKRALLVMAQAYRAQYGLNAIYLIPSNLYGPRDNFDMETSHVIPALIKKCFDAIKTKQKEIVVWGTGKATREFLYVENCAEGILLATERYNKSEPINLGTGFEISIKNLVELIVKLTGFKGEIVWDTSKPDGQPRRCLDTTKAEKEFGFKAKTPFEEGLKKTIDWYREQKR